jgi:hypothetical protein
MYTDQFFGVGKITTKINKHTQQVKAIKIQVGNISYFTRGKPVSIRTKLKHRHHTDINSSSEPTVGTFPHNLKLEAALIS